MPLGIRPTNDFAFKKTFGAPENKVALISLLNAILELDPPIVDVTIENPFNLQDFEEDKLSILDVKAVDCSGAIFHVEMQIGVRAGLVQRTVFYCCELYAGQLKHGVAYAALRPVYTICLLDGVLWPEAAQLHHAFRFSDRQSGRVLDGTVEIHMLELGKYNLSEPQLASARALGQWIYWLLHAHEYEPETLLTLFPEQAIQQATQTISRIAEITEDKIMYDAREKAVRDRQWIIESAYQEGEEAGKVEGEIEGEIKLIRTLQGLLGLLASDEKELRAMRLEQLEAISAGLQERLRIRTPS